jgi:hypothetical protein
MPHGKWYAAYRIGKFLEERQRVDMDSIWGHPDSLLTYGSDIPDATLFKRKAAFATSYKRIRRAYMKNPIALAVLKCFGELDESDVSIDVDSLLTYVPNLDNARQRTIQFLKELEEEKWGTFTTGRRGRKSRFEAPRGLRALSQLLDPKTRSEHDPNYQAEQPKVNEVGASKEGVNREPVSKHGGIKTLTHQFMLRPDYPLSLTLPVDLTGSEASRLSDFIKSLPFH